jgi:NTP pyrophosphatase (non-canonical NTP hydrolase)
MSNREIVSTEAVQAASKAFFEKLESKLKEKGLGTFKSSHEVLGVLQEEFAELVDAIRENDMEEFEEELLDIMIGAYWGLICSKNKTLDW